MIDVAKLTVPIPSACKTLETYGNVINGKIKFEMVRIKFIMKFILTELTFCIIVPKLSKSTYLPSRLYTTIAD